MVRIIQPGTIPTQDRWWIGPRITCPTCGCAYVLEASDRVVVNPFIPDAIETTCPTCDRSEFFHKPPPRKRGLVAMIAMIRRAL